MIEYDKVIRIDIDTELYTKEVSIDVTDWWTNYDDLKAFPNILLYLMEDYPEELKALKNKEIDYIVLSCDL